MCLQKGSRYVYIDIEERRRVKQKKQKEGICSDISSNIYKALSDMITLSKYQRKHTMLSSPFKLGIYAFHSQLIVDNLEDGRSRGLVKRLTT